MLRPLILASDSKGMTCSCGCIKTGKELYTWIPDWLVFRQLASLAWPSKGRVAVNLPHNDIDANSWARE